MRTKDEILDSTERNAKKATGPVDISLVHSLHTLEVLIDTRDIHADILYFLKTYILYNPDKH